MAIDIGSESKSGSRHAELSANSCFFASIGFISAEESAFPAKRHPAWVQGDRIEFYAGKIDFDWPAKTPSKYKNLGSRVVTDSLRKQMSHRDCPYSACFAFYTTLPANLTQGYYYFIAADGIRPVKLDRLRALIAYDFSDDYSRIEGSPSYSSNAQSAAMKLPLNGGFIAYSESPLVFHVKGPASVSAADYPIINDSNPRDLPTHTMEIRADGDRKRVYTEEEKKQFWIPKTAYAFRIEGGAVDYVFAEWPSVPEVISCEHRFSILTKEGLNKSLDFWLDMGIEARISEYGPDEFRGCGVRGQEEADAA